MRTTLIYIHSQYGSPDEAEHYRPLFPGWMCALEGKDIAVAYFISPIVDLERIEGVTLDEEHLRYVRQHPIYWHVPTHILYGENDNLTSLAMISDFARRTDASLEVMPGGEHWFHTPEQMAFLDEWIQRTSLAASYLNRSSSETEWLTTSL